jgi:hypothetical protein
MTSPGVGIFFIGAGVSVYHGLSGLLHPHEIEHYLVGMSVLGSAFAIEGYSLYIALGECRLAYSPPRISVRCSESTSNTLDVFCAAASSSAFQCKLGGRSRRVSPQGSHHTIEGSLANGQNNRLTLFRRGYEPFGCR